MFLNLDIDTVYMYESWQKCFLVQASDIHSWKLIGQWLNYVPALGMSSRKHYDPKFRKERAAKSLWVSVITIFFWVSVITLLSG